MALIKCPECNKEISDTAKKCVHCGYVLKRKKYKEEKHSKISYFIPLIIIILVFLIGTFVVSKKLTSHAFKEALDKKYNTFVSYDCDKEEDIKYDDETTLYNCIVDRGESTKVSCLKCKNSVFIFFPYKYDCDVISDYNCTTYFNN